MKQHCWASKKNKFWLDAFYEQTPDNLEEISSKTQSIQLNLRQLKFDSNLKFVFFLWNPHNWKHLTWAKKISLKKECCSSIQPLPSLTFFFFIAVIKFARINNATRNHYDNFLDFMSLKWSNEFKIFHKTKFKDLTNQRWPQRILVVWELCSSVVGLWLTAGMALKYFSSCLFSIVLFLKWKSMR